MEQPQEQMRILARILHELRFGVLLVGPDHKIQYVNRIVCERTGRDISTVIGAEIHDLMYGDNVKAWHGRFLDSFFADPRVITLERKPSTGGGHEFALKTREGKIEVGVSVSPFPVFEHNQMVSVRGVPNVDALALVTLVFWNDFQMFKEFQKLTASIYSQLSQGTDRVETSEEPRTCPVHPEVPLPADKD